MEIQNRYIGNNINTPNLSAKKKPAEKQDVTPTDSFQKQEAPPKDGGNLLTALLDLRVPTTSKHITEAQRNEILNAVQPGDIILETNNAYPGWQMLEKVALKSAFTHAAIYEGDGKFLEATTGTPPQGGVIRTDLKEYLEGPIKIMILRPDYKTPQDKKAALDFARSQLGKPYDGDFNLEDDKSIYCAELVQRALQSMPNKMEAPTVKFMGKNAVGPDAFQKIPGMKVVYSDGSSFLKNMASHYPVVAAGVATGTAGALLGGPVGGVLGFLGGMIFSAGITNKVQTGSFIGA